ncbi:MAG: hypothetical protein JNK05_13265 [Myxococcales bacterium]|nr:hypothetical protein [Myxococcales bacterium]
MMQGLPFGSVHAELMQRADRMLPDAIVHLSDVRMDAEERFEAPNAPTFRLNSWSRKQLAGELGLRWDKWFQSATPSERADEVNRRLSRMPGERKVRLWRDEEGKADGIARAILSPSFTPIDDLRIYDRLAATMKGALDEYRFTRIVQTDTSTQYTALHADAIGVDGDVHFPGWTMKNSEVGASALTLDDYMLRQVCTNGLMVPVGNKRLLYRTHRSIDDDQLAAAFVIALSRLPDRWTAIASLLTRAKAIEVPHPDTAIAAILESATVPRALVEEAQTIVLKEGDRTRFGVVQAITQVAHETNKDPEIRFLMERLAGQYLAAA